MNLINRICFMLCSLIIINILSACSVELNVNNELKIISFTASPVLIKKSKTTTLTTIVENPRNHMLSYNYQVLKGGGYITSMGPTAIYSVTNMSTNAEVMVVVKTTNGLCYSNTISLTVIDPYQKISATQGNFIGNLDSNDWFGSSVTCLGDLDNNGVSDIAVGAYKDNDGGSGRGAVWILFLNKDSKVKSYQKISATQGNFTGILTNGDFFGSSVTSIGDLDKDGVIDLAVGASGDASNKGAVWILFLNADGTVKSHQKITALEGGFTGTLSDADEFGSSMTSIGDFDKDGIPDIAVGSSGDSNEKGAIWLLLLNTDGTVKANYEISSTSGGFSGVLEISDWFGVSVANIGDLDKDGITDIAVGADGDDDDGNMKGAVWILFLNADGTVKSHQKISALEGGFTGTLSAIDYFGVSVANIGDLDKDGVNDIAVGTIDMVNSLKGAVWILFLNIDGTVKSHQKISSIDGNFTGVLGSLDYFGSSIANMGDINKDGVVDILVGAERDKDGGADSGAVWMLYLNNDGTVGN